MLKKFLSQKFVLTTLICLSVLVSSTAKTEFIRDNFDSTLAKWLAYIGYNGDVVEYQKLYDTDGYLDYFRILLQDRLNEKDKERAPTKIYVEVSDNESYQFFNGKMIQKDISNLPYMHADWIARYAISYSIKKISKALSLEAKTVKVREGLYRVTILPAKTTEPSRYRFNEIDIYYEVKDLFLTLDLTVKGPKDYLILTYFKSELNGILRALENGNFPGSTSSTLASQLSQEKSDYVIRDLLKLEEASHEILLLLEDNPSLKVEEVAPVD